MPIQLWRSSYWPTPSPGWRGSVLSSNSPSRSERSGIFSVVRSGARGPRHHAARERFDSGLGAPDRRLVRRPSMVLRRTRRPPPRRCADERRPHPRRHLGRPRTTSRPGLARLRLVRQYRTHRRRQRGTGVARASPSEQSTLWMTSQVFTSWQHAEPGCGSEKSESLHPGRKFRHFRSSVMSPT